MSDCCGGDSKKRGGAGAETGPAFCPKCGGKGKKVKRITLMALLRPEARGRLVDREYRFCRASDCDVVYFAEESSFVGEDLNVSVGQKSTDPSRYVCYCFNHTVQSIKEEYDRTGKTTVVESITAKIKAKQCACEYTNPQGTCCLGNVGQAVKEVIAAASE